jgi:putative integral membrane protein (TIGR02587 family)
VRSGDSGSWRRELKDFTRAFSGAYIFGVPLLFTMEMWWIGEYAQLWKLLAFLALAFVANLGLNYVAGFKRESSITDTLIQTIDVVAVGIVAASVMLLVLNRVALTDPIDSIVGKIVIQAVPLSIGASVANEIFGRFDEKSRQGEENVEALPAWQEFASDVFATVIGGIFIGFSIAPTEEITMLAAEVTYGHLLAIVLFTLLLSYGIVFASGFDQSRARGLFQHPVTETTLAYVVSLTVCVIMLYLFDQLEMDDPVQAVITRVVVLGLPMTVGGAAGRLVI